MSVSGPKVKGKKNIFSKTAQNFVKHSFGGVLRLDLGRGEGQGRGQGSKVKKTFFFEKP